MAEYLIGLACGHSWPGDAPSDTEAVNTLNLFTVAGDTANCPRCKTQQVITGPVSRVLGGDGGD